MKTTRTSKLKKTIATLLASALVCSLIPTGLVASAATQTLVKGDFLCSSAASSASGTIDDTDGSLTLSQTSDDHHQTTNYTATTFTYEADVQVLASSNGSSLVTFGITNRSNPSNGIWYAVNPILHDKKVRLFKVDNNSVTLDKSATLTDAQARTSHVLKIKVTVDSTKTIRVFLDGKLAIQTLDTSWSGGLVGLGTHKSRVKFSDVKLTTGEPEPLGTLTNLSVAGAPISPNFSADNMKYYAVVKNDVSTINVTSTATAGTNITVNGSAATSGVAKEVALTNGSNKILIDTGDGMSYILDVTRLPSAEDYSKQEYRPQFHLTPLANHMNDPNGLVYNPDTQTYHMYYQYNPDGLRFENQHWGHATSKDLIKWEEQPVAIAPDELGVIFSGCAVVDTENSSGFFTSNTPEQSKLVVLFTHDAGDTTQGHQKQSLAYSKDHGITWIKYEGNPVIGNPSNTYGRDFRDPKVFWHEESNQWLMIIAGGRARIFSSTDLKTWNHESDLVYQDGGEVHSECPDLFPLAVDGNAANTKWVYCGSGDWYIIGDLKLIGGGWTFVATSERIEPYNNAPEMYATQSFYNDPKGRRLLVSWLQEPNVHGLPSELAADGKNWKGIQSLPLVTELKTINGEVTLTSNPPEEIDAYRATTPLYSVANRTVAPTDNNILAGITAELFDIEATFTPGTATEFGFRVRTGSGKYTTVSYKRNGGEFILDKSNSGKATSGRFVGRAPVGADGKVKMRIIGDKSTIDAFANDGQTATNTFFYPSSQNVGMSFFTIGGDVTIDDMKIYNMESPYFNAPTGTAPERVLLSSNNTEYSVGEEFIVNGAIIPNTAADKKVNFTVSDSSVLQILETTDNSVKLKALKLGSAVVTGTSNTGDKVATTTITVKKPSFTNNMGELNGVQGSWTEDVNGFSVNNGGQDNAFAISSIVPNKPFTYEVTFDKVSGGTCSGLMFGVTNPANPIDGTWYAVNIDTMDNSTKMFKNAFNSQGWDVKRSLTSAERAKTSYTIKLEIDSNNYARYWIDGVYVNGRQLEDDFAGGNLGLVVYNSSGNFTGANVYYGKVSDTVSASIPSSTVTRGTPVILGTTAADGDIMYSTNGTDWNKYTTPIVINETTTISAKVVKHQLYDGDVTTFTYTVPNKKNGWITGSNGKKYYWSNDVLQKNKWVSNKTYRTDSKGAMVKNKFLVISKKMYRFNSNGKLRKGNKTWFSVGKNKYYLVKNVVQRSKTIKKGKKLYIVNSAGKRQTGSKFVTLGKKKYYIKKSFVQTNKWVSVKKKWYCANKKGILHRGKTVTIKGKKYNFNKKGVCTNRK